MEDIESFKPESLNIRSIFTNSTPVYVVPNYQRRYGWENEQLDELWTDLFEAFDSKVKCYFLGSIVVVQNKSELEIIDGQQRLTTLMIMFNVLNKTFPDLECVNPDGDDGITTIDNETLKQCIYVRKDKPKLKLQTVAEYGTDFNTYIITNDNFKTLKTPTKKQLKESNNPKFCFINTAKFFYDKFNELDKKTRNDFVYYIFNNVKIIRITCLDLFFAIKLFQVLNDRGMPLSSADIIKSYIMEKIDKDDDKERLENLFRNNWNYIETVCQNNVFKLDDFMVYYEYFKLKANPKKQVIEELKDIIKEGNNVEDIINELKVFADCLKNIYESTDPTIYSLRYLPWSAYVYTCLASAEFVKYGGDDFENNQDRNRLHTLMRRYFYLAFISGKTLNQIKQTSFNLLQKIVDKRPIEEIEKDLSDSIEKYKMIRYTYENLSGDVYNENYLKPLMLSIEYSIREKTDTTFYEIDKNMHMDHILPQKYYNELDWSYIDGPQALKYMNTLGNMALLYYRKNEEVLNKGFVKKVEIYSGKSGDGITSYDTTREIINVWVEKKQKWDIQNIKDRYELQMDRIENLLEISKEMIEDDNVFVENDNNESNKVQKLSRFSFEKLGIKPGSVLIYTKDNSIRCEVLDGHKVIYNGKTTSLSTIAKELLGYNVNGAAYFAFNGKIISDIRSEFEKRESN